MNAKINKLWFVANLLIISVVPVEAPQACGWWGDGEMQTHNQPSNLTTADGTPPSATLSLRSAKLPGRMGYGVAVPDPGQAVPYLNATGGHPITRIGDFKIFGFLTVIDLGASPETEPLHRAETESVGMRYVSIPIRNDMPNREQTKRFARTVIDGGTPLLVYAPRAAQLGAVWASYRLWLGSPSSYAIAEGKTLGLKPEQTAALLELIPTTHE